MPTSTPPPQSPVETRVPARFRGDSGRVREGEAIVRNWTAAEAFWRGGKKGLSLIGVVALIALPFAMVEPFLFMIWGSLLFGALFLLVGPLIHATYFGERRSLVGILGNCPECGRRDTLQPFLKTAWAHSMNVICASCGCTITLESAAPEATEKSS
ncbi:MAG: hypothetical protein IT285_02755 [Bdellovibrionales bacterium]|nr:hypothetical protein [Bdellovibrionales bacterium]